MVTAGEGCLKDAKAAAGDAPSILATGMMGRGRVFVGRAPLPQGDWSGRAAEIGEEDAGVGRGSVSAWVR